MGDVTRGPLQRARQQGVIPVTWDAENKRFIVAFRGFVLQKAPDPEAGVDIYFKPAVLYDVRIRKPGSSDWRSGFLAPYSAASFIGLEPDTEYEVQVSPVHESGNPIPNADILTDRFHTASNTC